MIGTLKEKLYYLLHKKDKINPSGISVVFYPGFNNPEDFSDQVYRIQWYIPKSSEVNVHMVSSRRFSLEKKPDYFAESLESKIPENLIVTKGGSKELLALVGTADMVAIWDNSKSKEIEDFLSKSGKKVKIAMIDKNDTSRREAFEYARLLTDLDPYPVREARKKKAIELLNKISEQYKDVNKSYVYGTGPSLDEAYDFDFSDGIRFISNSIVKNDRLLEHIRPNFVAAADPLFHYGCSRYAEEFRNELFKVLDKYNTYFFYSFFYSGLFETHFSEYVDRIVAIPQQHLKEFNFNLRKNYMLKGIDNVLTLMLLPVGATFTDEINILGCDGRKPDEDYFWQHSKQSQFNEHMDGIKLCHPGFFDHVVYEDYYEQHCENLETMLSQGESVGKKFNSLTTSYIPALVARDSRH